MLLPSPSDELIHRAMNDDPRGRVWMQSLSQTIQQCLTLWQLEWTRESLKQGYFSYVLPCRRLDGTSVILKLSPDIQSAREQAIALTGWAVRGGATLLGERSEENGAALLIERIYPGSYCDQAKTLTAGESLDVVGVSPASRLHRFAERCPQV
jgi:Aminoglycoside/hydroxyurea antibiotic resistance kinase